jgi:hypothetical protein
MWVVCPEHVRCCFSEVSHGAKPPPARRCDWRIYGHWIRARQMLRSRWLRPSRRRGRAGNQERGHCCRNFGTVSVVGVYGGYLDKIPMGSAINRGLTFRMAQTPVQYYLPKLMKLVEEGRIDPSFVITDRARLEDGPELYKKFRDRKDGCIKVVMKPGA